MPSLSSVTFIVAPSLGCPGSRIGVGVQDQWPRDASLCPDRLLDQCRCQVRTFALMNLPADDFPAEDVYDQIKAEEHARDRPGHPRDVPGPDLAGHHGSGAGGWFALPRRLCPTTMMLLPNGTQDAIEIGLRGQISPLIGQSRHVLAWRKAGEFR